MNHQLAILLIRRVKIRLRLSTWGPASLLRGSRGAPAWQCEGWCQGHPQASTVQLPRPSKAIDQVTAPFPLHPAIPSPPHSARQPWAEHGGNTKCFLHKEPLEPDSGGWAGCGEAKTGKVGGAETVGAGEWRGRGVPSSPRGRGRAAGRQGVSVPALGLPPRSPSLRLSLKLHNSLAQEQGASLRSSWLPSPLPPPSLRVM